MVYWQNWNISDSDRQAFNNYARSPAAEGDCPKQTGVYGQLVGYLPWQEGGPGHFEDRRKQRHSTVSFLCPWASL